MGRGEEETEGEKLEVREPTGDRDAEGELAGDKDAAADPLGGAAVAENITLAVAQGELVRDDAGEREAEGDGEMLGVPLSVPLPPLPLPVGDAVALPDLLELLELEANGLVDGEARDERLGAALRETLALPDAAAEVDTEAVGREEGVEGEDSLVDPVAESEARWERLARGEKEAEWQPELLAVAQGSKVPVLGSDIDTVGIPLMDRLAVMLEYRDAVAAYVDMAALCVREYAPVLLIEGVVEGLRLPVAVALLHAVPLLLHAELADSEGESEKLSEASALPVPVCETDGEADTEGEAVEQPEAVAAPLVVALREEAAVGVPPPPAGPLLPLPVALRLPVAHGEAVELRQRLLLAV